MEENNQKMLLPFTYNYRVCLKTDVLAQGNKKKKKKVVVPRSCLHGWVVSCLNLYLLYILFSIVWSNFLIFNEKKVHCKKNKINQIWNRWLKVFFLETAVLGVVLCCVVTSSPACAPKMRGKKEKHKQKIF